MTIQDPVAVVVVYVLMILGFLQVLKWFLIEVGDWWRWFRQWAKTL